jgi:hypothetical protein
MAPPREPISYEEFKRKLDSSNETAQVLSNPMLGAAKGAMKAFSATAELAPTAFGKGGKWDVPSKLQSWGVPDLRIPSHLSDHPAFHVEAKPEAVKAFSEFVSPTEGQERPSFGETFGALVEAQEERPLSQQFVTGILDPVGTGLTGGFGVAKGIGAGVRTGSQLLSRTPAATKALKATLITPREGVVSSLDEAISAATKEENWDQVLRLSDEKKRLSMPGVGEGVTGMNRRWAEDVYTPPGSVEVQRPLGSSHLWRGEVIPEGPSPRWLEDVKEVPGVLGATPRWIDEVAYNTGLTRPAAREPLGSTPRWRGEDVPEPESPNVLWREGAGQADEVPVRPVDDTPVQQYDTQTGELLPFKLPFREELRDTSGRLVNRLWGQQPSATQRAAEKTGEAVAETGRKAWTGTGIQPSDVGAEILPFREQVGGALLRGFGKAVDAILGGPGFRIEDKLADRAGEIQYSWVGRFGDDNQKLVTLALRDTIKSARKFRASEIEQAQAAERSKRVGEGLAAASRTRGREEAQAAFLSRQAGEIPASRINVEDLREGLGEEGIESVLNMVSRAGPIEGETAGRLNPNEQILRPFEGINAYTAIKELLEHGVVPTHSDMTLLERVFGDGVADELIKSRAGTIGRSGFTPRELILDVINMPRANISSFDLSFLLRQGGMMLPGQLKEATAAAEIAIKAIAPGGEGVARATQQAMMEADNGKLWDKYVGRGGLFIHGVGRTGSLVAREEAFLSSLASKAFPWVRASERGYATFLSKLRWDVLDDMVKKYEATLGRELDASNLDDLEIIKGMSSYINSATGRGPMLEKGADTISAIMNAMLFSPRLFTSRLAAPVQAIRQMTGIRPIAGGRAVFEGRPVNEVIAELYPRAVQGDEAARNAYKQMSRTVTKQMAAWFGTGMTIMALAKGAQASGVPIEVGTDWRSSDFGKVKIGKTRVDIWSGYTQIARAIGQLKEGESKSAQTGQVRPVSPIDVLFAFTRSKFAPSVGIVSDYNVFGLPGMGERWGKGTGFFGEDRDILEDAKRLPVRFSNNIPMLDEQSFWTQFMGPLVLRDLGDAIDEYMQPTLPNEVLNKVDETGKEPPGLVRQWAENVGAVTAGLGVGAAAAAGLGITTYTTRDEMAQEFTKDLPGGPYKYLQLQPFEQDMVDEMAEAREAESGVTRTQGIGPRLDASEANELQQYESLASRVDDMTVRDVRNEYYDIKNRFRIRRNQMLEDEFGARDEEELQRLREEGMGPVRQRVEEFYTLQRKAEERKGDDLNYEEYESILNDWETRMSQSGSPLDAAAVIMVRMNAHRTDLPSALLQRLSPQSRTRYNAARELRAAYRRGELRNELYGQ